jgi:ATP-dependent protease ClpP protease subunit
MHGARPLRSTRRLSNLMGSRPGWYRITNGKTPALPTQVDIYDEIGFFGVSAAEFLSDLRQITSDVELHINSPGGDVFDGIAIFNVLKQRPGNVRVIVDGLAASAASFIAQAATPGCLEMAPHSQMMIHDGFAMGIGTADDMRELADQLDQASDNIASIYAGRSGKPVAYWRSKMQAETWYTDAGAVADGLADKIHGQDAPSNGWDLSVFAKYAGVSDTTSKHCPACRKYNSPDAGTCSACGEKFPGTEPAAPADAADPGITSADGPAQLGDGWVQDPSGAVRFDPDGDGDDDSTAEGDTDHDYWDADGNQIQEIPPQPPAQNAAGDGGKGDDGDQEDDEHFPDGTKKPFPGAKPPFKKDRAAFPVLNADVDNSPWDASKAWHNGTESDDPAAFYKGICAGRKAGDPKTQAAWALPYKYHPGDAPNAAGVRNALSRLPQTEGLTNAEEATATLQKVMKQISPDYDPDDPGNSALADPAVLSQLFARPQDVDTAPWSAAAAMAGAAASDDPEAFYRGICAGRRAGDPATPAAWALPYKYAPGRDPNADGVRAALAGLATARDLTNPGEARGVLERAIQRLHPAAEPDDYIDTDLLAAVFANGLEGAGR